MTMKITNGQLIDSWPALQRLGALTGLPTTTSYWLGKSFRKLGVMFQDFEAARIKMVREHAETDADGKLVMVGAGITVKDALAFEAQFLKLRAIEIDVDVKLVALKDLGPTALSPSDFAALHWLIEE